MIPTIQLGFGAKKVKGRWGLLVRFWDQLRILEYCGLEGGIKTGVCLCGGGGIRSVAVEKQAKWVGKMKWSKLGV